MDSSVGCISDSESDSDLRELDTLVQEDELDVPVEKTKAKSLSREDITKTLMELDKESRPRKRKQPLPTSVSAATKAHVAPKKKTNDSNTARYGPTTPAASHQPKRKAQLDGDFADDSATPSETPAKSDGGRDRPATDSPTPEVQSTKFNVTSVYPTSNTVLNASKNLRKNIQKKTREASSVSLQHSQRSTEVDQTLRMVRSAMIFSSATAKAVREIGKINLQAAHAMDKMGLDLVQEELKAVAEAARGYVLAHKALDKTYSDLYNEMRALNVLVHQIESNNLLIQNEMGDARCREKALMSHALYNGACSGHIPPTLLWSTSTNNNGGHKTRPAVVSTGADGQLDSNAAADTFLDTNKTVADLPLRFPLSHRGLAYPTEPNAQESSHLLMSLHADRPILFTPNPFVGIPPPPASAANKSKGKKPRNKIAKVTRDVSGAK